MICRCKFAWCASSWIHSLDSEIWTRYGAPLYEMGPGERLASEHARVQDSAFACLFGASRLTILFLCPTNKTRQ